MVTGVVVRGLKCGFLGKTQVAPFLLLQKKRAREKIADVLDDGNHDDKSLFTNYHQH